MKTSKVIVNKIEFPTLLAISEAEQQVGLMHRTTLPDSMSFIYQHPKINKFWMHNTPCALDIVFCNGGKIISIAKGEPFSTSLIGPDCATDLVIEFPYGTCSKMKIKEGDEVALPEMQDTGAFKKQYY